MRCRAPAPTSTSSWTRASCPTASVTCALHLSRFDITDGEPLDPPADLPLATYAVRLDGEDIVLELPEGDIPINE